MSGPSRSSLSLHASLHVQVLQDCASMTLEGLSLHTYVHALLTATSPKHQTHRIDATVSPLYYRSTFQGPLECSACMHVDCLQRQMHKQQTGDPGVALWACLCSHTHPAPASAATCSLQATKMTLVVLYTMQLAGCDSWFSVQWTWQLLT